MNTNPIMVVTLRGPSWMLAELEEEAEHLGWTIIAPKQLETESDETAAPTKGQ